MVALRTISVCVLAVALFGCATTPDGLAPIRDSEPSPELTPREVVQIQLRAFGNNNAEDEGIEIGFRFASPDNRRRTGPLPRFAAMLKGPAYGVMLEHDRAEYAEVVVRDGQAVQRVRLIRGDTVAVYDFYLRRQSGTDCQGCWMTEAVYLFGAGTVREGPQAL
ncbi:MAG TPA: DUF4864 domain-containing protein [Alkalispirochaeta sp.]|nr:DUF4864 domain-containing protein [Alkalispirochaeta sp.]